MIRVERLGFRTADTGALLLDDISLHIRAGERVGITGPSGSGKTTLALHLAGLHRVALMGHTTGSLRLNGNDCAQCGCETFAGIVLQNPEIQLFCNTVEEEIEMSLQSRSGDLDRKQELERLLALFGLDAIRAQYVTRLSLGWKQRLSVASMLALGTEVLLLDEPTSYLDDAAAKLLFDVLKEQTAQRGLTVIVIEHDLPRLKAWASRLLAMRSGRLAFDGSPADYPMRPQLSATGVAGHEQLQAGDRVLSMEQIRFSHPGGQAALEDVSLSISTGEIVALVGPNGAGKSTFLALVKGLLEPNSGKIVFALPKRRMDAIGLVFQNPDWQLFAHSVFEECAFLPRNQGFSEDELSRRARQALERVGLLLHADRMPFSLSYGEKRRLTLASSLCGESRLVCVDEPTVGLDGECLNQLAGILRGLVAQGGAVLLATHDRDFVKAVATRVVSLRAGRIVDDCRLRRCA